MIMQLHRGTGENYKNLKNNMSKETHNKTNGSGFISEPKTLKEFENNVEFQFSNVAGWMSVKDYESALIKARCLVDALEKLIKNSSL